MPFNIAGVPLNVTVINLPRSEKKLLVHDIIRSNTKLRPITMNDLIELIEYELLDIVEMFIKEGIRNSSNFYYILGGKAISNAFSISKRSTISRSFDFDIHVREADDIKTMSNNIASNANEQSREYYMKVYNKWIYYKLKGLNIVDESDEGYYTDGDIFCYGKRFHRTQGFHVNSVMLKLKLKNSLFKYDNAHKIYTNKLPDGTMAINGLANNYDIVNLSDNGDNFIYLPIIDIDQDVNLHKGVIVLKTSENTNLQLYTNRSSYDDLIYANIFVSAFNLIRMLSHGYKIDNNILKLKNLFNMNNISCERWDSTNDVSIEESCDKILRDIETHYDNITHNSISILTLRQDIRNRSSTNETILNRKLTFGGQNLLDLTYSNIMLFLKNMLINGRANYTIMYGGDNDINNIQYIFSGISQPEVNNRSNILANLSYDADAENGADAGNNRYNINHRIAFKYTTEEIYQNMNNWCNYKAHGLNIVNSPNWTKNITKIARILNNNSGNIQKIINIPHTWVNYGDYEDLVNSLDHTIEKFCRNLKNTSNTHIYQSLPEYFQTITFQKIINLTSGVSGIIGISDLRQGDVFNYPQFISTTYDPRTNLKKFSIHDRSIIRIRIPKKSNKWMFMGEYSRYQVECEIIIKRNTNFIVTNI
jgi:hypothetical protein